MDADNKAEAAANENKPKAKDAEPKQAEALGPNEANENKPKADVLTAPASPAGRTRRAKAETPAAKVKAANDSKPKAVVLTAMASSPASRRGSKETIPAPAGSKMTFTTAESSSFKFKLGDRVRVVEGTYKGRTGVLVSKENKTFGSLGHFYLKTNDSNGESVVIHVHGKDKLVRVENID